MASSGRSSRSRSRGARTTRCATVGTGSSRRANGARRCRRSTRLRRPTAPHRRRCRAQLIRGTSAGAAASRSGAMCARMRTRRSSRRRGRCRRPSRRARARTARSARTMAIRSTSHITCSSRHRCSHRHTTTTSRRRRRTPRSTRLPRARRRWRAIRCTRISTPRAGTLPGRRRSARCAATARRTSTAPRLRHRSQSCLHPPPRSKRGPARVSVSRRRRRRLCGSRRIFRSARTCVLWRAAWITTPSLSATSRTSSSARCRSTSQICHRTRR
mmetsp:Transcript_24419/g.63012  ORF Transcript_24419/g.63012 Transcript_24419/m.63012 type:complete len:272 (+) Transcript_24419:797-1612(+)